MNTGSPSREATLPCHHPFLLVVIYGHMHDSHVPGKTWRSLVLLYHLVTINTRRRNPADPLYLSVSQSRQAGPDSIYSATRRHQAFVMLCSGAVLSTDMYRTVVVVHCVSAYVHTQLVRTCTGTYTCTLHIQLAARQDRIRISLLKPS